MTSETEVSTTDGMAISRSDVGDMPDSPIGQGEVLFVPEEHVGALSETIGADLSDPNISRHAFFNLEEEQVVEVSGVVEDIGDEGGFPVEVQAGRYLVCLANIFVDHTPGPPYSVVGCDLVDLPDNPWLVVSHGEGGVAAALD